MLDLIVVQNILKRQQLKLFLPLIKIKIEMECLKKQVKQIKKNHEILTKVVKNLIESVVIVEKKLEDIKIYKHSNCQSFS